MPGSRYVGQSQSNDYSHWFHLKEIGLAWTKKYTNKNLKYVVSPFQWNILNFFPTAQKANKV